MSEPRLDAFLERNGVSRALPAPVVGLAFSGERMAVALGDGHAHLLDLRARDAWRDVAVHDGAALALSAAPGGFVSGGDDGRFVAIGAEGGVTEIASLGGRWIEHVAVHHDPRAPLLACATGKRVHVFDGGGRSLKVLEHPATVSGVVFDAKGKRVCASHYGGASLWFVAAKVDSPRRLEWKGSHTDIAISPDGDAVVTAMQENALHGWRLGNEQHMRMSGYPAKTRFMSFSRNGKWLATSGAEAVVLWPFFGGGPMGKAPTELAGGVAGVLCTAVAFHPQHEMLAAGFSDGVVVLADVASARVLPLAGPGRGAVSALAWSPTGADLGFGTEAGYAAVLDLTGKARPG